MAVWQAMAVWMLIVHIRLVLVHISLCCEVEHLFFRVAQPIVGIFLIRLFPPRTDILRQISLIPASTG